MADGEAPVTCSWCGSMKETAPLTWTMEIGERGPQWMCEKCTRANVRSVEAKLPGEWW